MSLPASFLTELALDGPRFESWVEIEGLPYGFGLSSSPDTSGRYVELRRRGILPQLLGPIDGLSQEARPFEADSSIGQMTARLLLDGDGFVRDLVAHVARTDGWGRLGEDLGEPAAASGAPVAETFDATLPPGTQVGDLLYCGRETMEVTALPGGGQVTAYRAMFRAPGESSRRAYVHTAGDVLSLYPRFLATRRATVYALPVGGSDSDRVVLWAGTVRGASLGEGLSVLHLVMESIESDLKVTIFGKQIRGKLLLGLADPTGSYDEDEGEPPPLYNRVRLEPSSISGRAWTENERVVFQIGDEIIAGRLRTHADYPNEIHFDDAVTYTEDARGLFGSFAVAHDRGEEVVEVLPIIAHRTGGQIEERVSKFTQGDNPLDVALQLILSAKGDAGNGSHDVLPEGWGCPGIDQTRVDVAGILALRDRWVPAAREIRIIREPTNLKSLLASILRTHLCYPVSRLNDVLTFRFLGPPMPDAAPRAVGSDHVTEPPSWDAGLGAVVGRLTVKCDLDPIEGEFRQTYVAELAGPGVEAQEFYAGLFESLTVECPGQWSGNDPGSAKFGARLSTDAESIALRLFDLTRDRRSRALPTLGLRLLFDALDVEVGDLLALTVDGAPDVASGGDGLSGSIVEVRRKTPSLREGVVSLSVVQTAYGLQHRLVAPSAIVASVAAPTITVNANEFSASPATDRDSFPAPTGTWAGYKVAVWSPDLTTKRGSYTVSAVGANTISVVESLAGVSAGDVVLLEDASSQPSGPLALFAFLADNGAPPLIGSAQAHEYAP